MKRLNKKDYTVKFNGQKVNPISIKRDGIDWEITLPEEKQDVVISIAGAAEMPDKELVSRTFLNKEPKP